MNQDLVEKYIKPEDVEKVKAAVTAEMTPKPQVDVVAVSPSEPTTAAELPAKADVICPTCGENITQFSDENISSDDRIRWVRHVVGNVTFKKTYLLFDGMVQVTFRTRQVNENDLILSTLSKEYSDLVGFGPSSFASRDPAYVARMYRLEAISSLDTIRRVDLDTNRVSDEKFGSLFDPANTPDPASPDTFMSVAYRNRTKNMPEALLNGIVTRYNEFVTLTNTLTKKSRAPGFWKPTVSAG